MPNTDHLQQLAGDGFLYLATPYSKHPEGIDAAFRYACHAAGRLLSRGVKAFSPIAHSHPIAIHGNVDPLSHEIWLAADRPFMQAARGMIVVMMPGWETSYGVQQEIAAFNEMQKPIHYLPWPIG